MAAVHHEQVPVAGISSSSKEELVRTNSKEMDLFMLYNHFSGTIAYSLYRIQVSYPCSSSSPDFDHSCASRPNFQPVGSIKPFLEFPSGLFPENMCCVELDSKLYFLGGQFGDGISLPDVYVIDTTDIEITSTSNNNIQKIMKKNIAGQLRKGKADPYAFVVNKKIFVINNKAVAWYNRDFSFEVFSPFKKRKPRSKLLPDPPFDFVVQAHAHVDGKLFLTGHSHILCFDLEKYEWVQDFIQEFSAYHAFYGEGHLFADTLYAIGGFNAAIPAAYKFDPDRVKQSLLQCSEMNKELSIVGRCTTDLFDELAMLSPDLKGVIKHVKYDWLDTCLLHPDDGTFCYVSSGVFPHELYPQYAGVTLVFFKPFKEFFTEEFSDFQQTSFTGEFLFSTHLKFDYKGGHDIGVLRGCFSVS